MQATFRKITSALLLVSFLTVVFFGFAAMSRGADGSMQGDCPFSNMGTSLCPQSALPGAIHHIGAYQSFLNTPTPSGLTASMLALLLVLSVALAFVFRPLLYWPLAFISYTSPPSTSSGRKIKHWLSLFELSPSL